MGSFCLLAILVAPALAANGDILTFAGNGGNVIRKISASTGVITNFAGNGVAGSGGDGGPATSASLNGPGDLAMDGAGNIYIADTNNSKIRKVTPGGTISTFAGTGTSGSF